MKKEIVYHLLVWFFKCFEERNKQQCLKVLVCHAHYHVLETPPKTFGGTGCREKCSHEISFFRGQEKTKKIQMGGILMLRKIIPTLVVLALVTACGGLVSAEPTQVALVAVKTQARTQAVPTLGPTPTMTRMNIPGCGETFAITPDESRCVVYTVGDLQVRLGWPKYESGMDQYFWVLSLGRVDGTRIDVIDYAFLPNQEARQQTISHTGVTGSLVATLTYNSGVLYDLKVEASSDYKAVIDSCPVDAELMLTAADQGTFGENLWQSPNLTEEGYAAVQLQGGGADNEFNFVSAMYWQNGFSRMRTLQTWQLPIGADYARYEYASSSGSVSVDALNCGGRVFALKNIQATSDFTAPVADQ